jgi:hypothetical protein
MHYIGHLARHLSALLLITSSALCYAGGVDTSKNFTFTESANEYEIAVYINNKNKKNCGLSVNFGDGSSVRNILNLEDLEVGIMLFTYKHKYPDSKGYLVQTKGVRIPGGFFSSEKPTCEIVSNSEFWVPIDNSPENMKFEFIMESRYAETFLSKNIDGTISFRPTDGHTRELCVTLAPYSFVTGRQGRNESVWFGMSRVLASNLPFNNTAEALMSEAKNALRKMGWTGSVDTNCGAYGSIVAIPGPFKNAIDLDINIKKSISLFSISFQQIELASKKIINEKANLTNAIENTYTEYDSQSKTGNKDWIGSLFIANNKRSPQGNLRVCNINYSPEETSLFSSYLDFDIDTLAKDAMRATLLSNRDHLNQDFLRILDHLTQDWRKPKKDNTGKAFKDLNELYIAINQNRNCDVIIDYPANIVKLRDALIRDDRHSSVFGKLILTEAVKDKYAIELGFSNYNEYVFAKNIGLNASQAVTLKKFGVETQVEYEKTIKDILQLGYSASVDTVTVLDYLQDYSDASRNKISVLKQRSQRLDRERLAKKTQKREEAKQLEEFSKEYPYQAVLTCGFNNDHINILGCFAGGSTSVGTELELRNGSYYRLLKPWEISSLGQDSYQRGFIVPLRSTFSIKIQNASDHLILGLKIVSTKTKGVLFEKSVGHYGVIRATN